MTWWAVILVVSWKLLASKHRRQLRLECELERWQCYHPLDECEHPIDLNLWWIPDLEWWASKSTFSFQAVDAVLHSAIIVDNGLVKNEFNKRGKVKERSRWLKDIYLFPWPTVDSFHLPSFLFLSLFRLSFLSILHHLKFRLLFIMLSSSIWILRLVKPMTASNTKSYSQYSQ